MKIHVFGSWDKKLDYIGKVIAPSCVCVCACVSFVSSDRRLQIVFHSLKARVFLCGDEGEGTEAFLVNIVERSLLIGFNVCSSFRQPFHLLFSCVWNLTCFL